MRHKTLKIFFGIICALTFIVTVPSIVTALNADHYVDAVVILEDNVWLNLDSVNLKFQYEELNGFAGRMPTSLFNTLAKSSFVSSIQLDRTVTLCEDTLNWGVDDTDAEEVWGGFENAVNVVSGNIAGTGVKVAVLDTGIDYNHPDLDGNYVGGYDFVNNDAYPMDDHSHGTHCAGIIAAEDNGQGVIGVAPKASLYAAKVLNSAGSGTISQIVAGIDWAIDNNMDVASMSLRSTTSDSAMEDACNRAHAAGVIVVAATGNDYSSSIGYPARYTSTIAVGAIDSSRSWSSYSNYGPQIDVVAPGTSIYSTVLSGSYGTKTGTSMATPMVSGACALILEANPSLTVEEVRTILHTTSDDLGATGFDYYYGYGTIDCVRAVEAAGGTGDDTTPPTVSITAPSNGATVSGSVSITATASDNVGVSKVACNIDGGTWTDDTTSPYSWTWDTTSLTDGSTHTINCRAYDAAGNYADDSVTVTVDNSGPGDNEITSGVPVTGTLSSVGETEMWYIDVAANCEQMEAILTCGSADFDLYGRLGAEPTTSTYDWRGYTYGGEEVTTANPGEGHWYIMVRDYSGSGAYELTVTLTFSGPDTTPPTVSITSPSDGATVSGTLSITASASDNEGVSYVQCRVNSGTWTDDTASPYSWTLDTTSYSDGTSLTIDCRAYDAAGNYADDSVTVTVDNSVSPTEGEWGVTASGFTTSSTHSVIRYMGGTSPSFDITVTHLYIRCASSGTVSIALYTGGSLSSPTSAVQRTEAHNVAVSAGWNAIDVPDFTVPANTVTWIGWAHNCRVYYSSSSSNAGDFQSTRGRWSQSSPTNYDETSALPSNPGSGSFSNYWYAVYAKYTAMVSSTDVTIQFSDILNFMIVTDVIKFH